MTRASMGRILSPRSFFVNGVVVCPDCGTTAWGSFRCRCGARVLGPRRKPHAWDPAERVWLIDRDGAAWLWDRLADELVPFADATGPWPPLEEPDPSTPWSEVMT